MASKQRGIVLLPTYYSQINMGDPRRGPTEAASAMINRPISQVRRNFKYNLGKRKVMVFTITCTLCVFLLNIPL